MRLLKAQILLCASLPLALIGGAHAADHNNLEEGLPVEVEDAYPTAYTNTEFQLQSRYERTASGDDQFVLRPALEYGFSYNWQAKIEIPFRFGEEDGVGDVGVELFHNFNTETLSTPAFAISARADLPTGDDSRGVDARVKFIATKTLGKGQNLQRLHLNLAYFYNASARDDERDDGYVAIVGYSQRLNADTIFVADYVREQEKEASVTTNIVEAGIRRQVTPLRTLSFGLGAGLDDDSPDFRLTLGLQQSF